MMVRAGAWLDGDGRMWLRRFVIGVLVAAVLILLAFLGAAFLPRWWAHRIAHQVNGGMTTGIILGLFYGFVFTDRSALHRVSRLPEAAAVEDLGGTGSPRYSPCDARTC